MAPTTPPTPPAQPGGGTPGTPPPGSPGMGSGRSPNPRASSPPDHPPGHRPPGERSDDFPEAGRRAPGGEPPSDVVDPMTGTSTPGGADESGGDTPPGFDLLHPPGHPPVGRPPDARWPRPLGSEVVGTAAGSGPEGATDAPRPGLASPPGSVVPPTGSGSRDSWQAWATWGSLGMEFAAGIVVFFLLGSWADARWGTDPWLRLAGTFVGIVLGTYLLIKKALATTFTDRRDSTDRRGEPPRQGS